MPGFPVHLRVSTVAWSTAVGHFFNCLDCGSIFPTRFLHGDLKKENKVPRPELIQPVLR